MPASYYFDNAMFGLCADAEWYIWRNMMVGEVNQRLANAAQGKCAIRIPSYYTGWELEEQQGDQPKKNDKVMTKYGKRRSSV